jgi:enoyl-CoA hydratase/carnithine racemase
MTDGVLVEQRDRILIITINRPAEAFGKQMEIMRPVFESADAREGAQAFAEKRPPVWRGE